LVLPSIPPGSENAALTFTLSVTGVTGTPAYSMVNQPAGAILNSTSGVFTWTPTYSQSGNYNISFSVTDSAGSDTKTAIITVADVNRVPTINPGSVTVNSDEDYASVAISASDPDGQTLTYSIIAQPANTSIASCSIDGSSLRATRGSSLMGQTTKTTQCTVQASDGSLTAQAVYTINVESKSMLEITKMYAIVASDSNSQSDGDSFDVKPGDSLEFKVTIKNLYTGDTNEEEVDIEDINLQITVEEWDQDGDQDWDVDAKDLKYDDKDDITLSLGTIPYDTDDGSHQVTIELTGKDGDNSAIKYKVTWTLDMNVEKDNEDIRISTAELTPSTVSCDRNVLLSVKLTNAGTENSDEIIFWAKGGLLGSPKEEEIDLDSGDSTEKEYNLIIGDSVAAGTYELKLYTYFDIDRYDENDISNAKTLQLRVEKCVPEVPPVVIPPKCIPNWSCSDWSECLNSKQSRVCVDSKSCGVSDNKPAESQSCTVVPSATLPSIFGDTRFWLIGGLVLLNVLLLIGIIVLLARLFR